MFFGPTLQSTSHWKRTFMLGVNNKIIFFSFEKLKTISISIWFGNIFYERFFLPDHSSLKWRNFKLLLGPSPVTLKMAAMSVITFCFQFCWNRFRSVMPAIPVKYYINSKLLNIISIMPAIPVDRINLNQQQLTDDLENTIWLINKVRARSFK